ncbi:MAG: hypothetical protein ACKVQW_11045 [Pyrinomonadaceae bacterium]
MFGKKIIRKSVTAMTLGAVWCVYSTVAFAAPVDSAAEITVTGQVTINGQQAISNATVLSGSVISTGSNSSAVVSLGKLGRVEISADSSLTLNFGANNIIAIVDSGKVRVSASTGVATTATTKHATFIADSSQANNFVLEVECSHTHIDATSGSVIMREGSNDKQVAAGSSATAGSMEQAGCKPCLRPGSTPGPAFAGWPWLLLVAAGVAGAGILLGQDDDTDIGGGTVVVSPTR